jgi:hypothetical protein
MSGIDRTYAATKEQQRRLRERALEKQQLEQQQLEQEQLRDQRLREQALERRRRLAERMEAEGNARLEEAREAVETKVRMNTKRKAMNVLKDNRTRNRRLYSSIIGEINNDKRKAKYDELTNREIEKDRKSRAEGELLYRQHTESVQNRKDAKERADIAIAELAHRNAELEARHLRESLKNRRESKERENKAVAEWEARHYRESMKSREEAKERENMALHQKYWSDHQAEWNRLERESRQVPHGERENRWTFWEPRGERENPWTEYSEEPNLAQSTWQERRTNQGQTQRPRSPPQEHRGKTRYSQHRKSSFFNNRRPFTWFDESSDSPRTSPPRTPSPPRRAPSPPRTPSPPRRAPSPPRSHASPTEALRSQIQGLFNKYPGPYAKCKLNVDDATNDIIALYNDSANRGLFKKTILKYHPDKNRCVLEDINKDCENLAAELIKIINNTVASGKKGKKTRKQRRH